MSISIYLHEKFVQVPSPVRVITRRGMKSFLSDLTANRAKPIPPIADRYMTNINAALRKKVSDISQRKRMNSGDVLNEQKRFLCVMHGN